MVWEMNDGKRVPKKRKRYSPSPETKGSKKTPARSQSSHGGTRSQSRKRRATGNHQQPQQVVVTAAAATPTPVRSVSAYPRTRSQSARKSATDNRQQVVNATPSRAQTRGRNAERKKDNVNRGPSRATSRAASSRTRPHQRLSASTSRPPPPPKRSQSSRGRQGPAKKPKMAPPVDSDSDDDTRPTSVSSRTRSWSRKRATRPPTPISDDSDDSDTSVEEEPDEVEQNLRRIVRAPTPPRHLRENPEASRVKEEMVDQMIAGIPEADSDEDSGEDSDENSDEDENLTVSTTPQGIRSLDAPKTEESEVTTTIIETSEAKDSEIKDSESDRDTSGAESESGSAVTSSELNSTTPEVQDSEVKDSESDHNTSGAESESRTSPESDSSRSATPIRPEARSETPEAVEQEAEISMTPLEASPSTSPCQTRCRSPEDEKKILPAPSTSRAESEEPQLIDSDSSAQNTENLTILDTPEAKDYEVKDFETDGDTSGAESESRSSVTSPELDSSPICHSETPEASRIEEEMVDQMIADILDADSDEDSKEDSEEDETDENLTVSTTPQGIRSLDAPKSEEPEVTTTIIDTPEVKNSESKDSESDRDTSGAESESGSAATTPQSNSTTPEAEKSEIKDSESDRDTSGAESESRSVATSPELNSGPIHRDETSEAVEQVDDISTTPPARRQIRSRSKVSVPPTFRPESEEPLDSDRPSTSTRNAPRAHRQENKKDIQSTSGGIGLKTSPESSSRVLRRRSGRLSELKEISSASSSSSSNLDRPSTSSRNAPRAEQQKNKENVPSTSEKKLDGFGCCGLDLDLKYHAANLRCVGKKDNSCRIAPDAQYQKKMKKKKDTEEEEEEDEFYCLPCFEAKEFSERKKANFESDTNRNTDSEPILTCKKCELNWHLNCSFYYGKNMENFICEKCSETPVRKTIGENQWRSRLGDFMTAEMMEFLKGKHKDAEKHAIRICTFSAQKSAQTSEIIATKIPKLNQKFVEKYSETMKYTSRAIHVFQRVTEERTEEKIDVITFSIFTQEFPMEPVKWVVIDYLDSLPYFHNFGKEIPKKEIHRKIFHSYYQYMGGLGYRKSHLWSNPPVKNDDYVFNIHPFEQFFLDAAKLIRWYEGWLTSGVENGTFLGFLDFGNWVLERGPIDFPIFPGSIWTIVFGEIGARTMKQFLKDLEKKKLKHAEDNFIIDIAEPKVAQTPETSYNTHEVLGDRESLLNHCMDKEWQFETLRRAKYASVGLIRMMEEEEH